MAFTSNGGQRYRQSVVMSFLVALFRLLTSLCMRFCKKSVRRRSVATILPAVLMPGGNT